MRQFTISNYLAKFLFIVTGVVTLAVSSNAQIDAATLSGTVVDETGAVVPGVEVIIENPATGFRRNTTTNASGIYVFPALQPGTYTVRASKDGFAPIENRDVVLNIGDRRGLRIQMKVGAVNAEVTVVPDPVLSNETAAVSTVVDRNLVENIPLSGRDFQSLINLSPGVIAVPPSENNTGQFSINGQRTNSNYFIVDGVSANAGISARLGDLGQQGSGSLPGTNVQGGLSNQASIDAIQEFQILTSTFAPEYGRTPGGQVIINTRSGENKYHGALYEYFRNDIFDANDFFNNANGRERPALRFNNFGGTFSGPLPFLNFGEGVPIFSDGKDRTHFFVSYEGQRFLLPKPSILAAVPTQGLRQSATNPVAKALYEAFPQATGPESLTFLGTPSGMSEFSSSFSDPNESDSLSVRVDHNYKSKYTFFGRFNWAPSKSSRRDSAIASVVQEREQNTRLFTFGATQVFTPSVVNDFRFNWTRQEGKGQSVQDGFGGAIPLSEDLLVPPGSGERVNINIVLLSFSTLRSNSLLNFGDEADNVQRQINVVDNITFNTGDHQLKFGGDYRRLRPFIGGIDLRNFFLLYTPGAAAISALFGAPVLSVNDGFAAQALASRGGSFTSKFDTYSLYAQDTWKINPRLTTTFGVRWEINPAPGFVGAPTKTFARAPDLTQQDQSGLSLVEGPFYETDYTNFAPRFGLAYRAIEKAGRELVIRGGIGVFYDLGQAQFASSGDTFFSSDFRLNSPVPPAPWTFTEIDQTPGPFNRISATSVDPNHATPRTYQWNLTAEQTIGKNHALSVAYVGAAGRKLQRVINLSFAPAPGLIPGAFWSPNFSGATISGSNGESDYHSMQTQFMSRLTDRFTANVNYTWAHSIDNASNDRTISLAGIQIPAEQFRGDSDFDVRHNLTGAVTYQIPEPEWGKAAKAIFGGWTLNSLFFFRSGLPFDVTVIEDDLLVQTRGVRRPNVTGQPIWINDSSLAGGRKLNPDAFDFVNLPTDGTHGNLGRNAIRGLGAWQINAGLHRNFKLWEGTNLQFRVEAFNVLNKPNFLNPTFTNARVFQNPPPGQSNVLLSGPWGEHFQSLSQSAFGLVQNPLFASGGPRSMQFALRFTF